MDLATPVKVSEIREEESYMGGGRSLNAQVQQGQTGRVIKMAVGFGIGLCT